MEEIIAEFSTKEALKALEMVSTILEESNPDHGVALRVVSQSLRELRKKRGPPNDHTLVLHKGVYLQFRRRTD